MARMLERHNAKGGATRRVPPLAVHARRPRRPRPRKVMDFGSMVQRVSDRFGKETAVRWTKAVIGHQNHINEQALRDAILSGDVSRIEKVVGPEQLQRALQGSSEQTILGTTREAGKASAKVLKRSGVSAPFNAMHPNVVHFARERAAELVAKVPNEVRQVIAEVVARGAERGLTVAEQARAIREVVGLPPNWAKAPSALEQALRDGDEAAATSRRLSAKTKQQIRSRMKNGNVTESFIRQVVGEYKASLIHARAINIARTETQRAANFGLHESWKQASEAGTLPKTARRFWLVTPDARLSEEHATIPGMNPAGRGMDEPFETTEGPCMYPPSRPNCRCSVGLAFTDGANVIEGGGGSAPATAPARPPRQPRQPEQPPTPAPAPPPPPTPTSRPLGVPDWVPEHQRLAIEQAVKDVGVPTNRLRYTNKPKYATSGGVRGMVLGEYHDGRLEVLVHPSVPLKESVATAAHEATHLKFDVAARADLDLFTFIGRNFDQLKADDGVTSYSTAHWKHAEKLLKGQALSQASIPAQLQASLAVEETLTEMAAMRAGGKEVGSALYKQLNKLLDRKYKKAIASGG